MANLIKNSYGVLFVCTGNICRSPTAEGVFLHHAAQAGFLEKIHADSAGTHGYHIGDPPDPRAVKVAKARGVDLSPLRARKVGVADFAEYDLILAMDQGHYNILNNMAPARARASLSLFLDYAPQAGLADTPDPYYGGEQDFIDVYDLIETGVRGLVEFLHGPLKIAP